MTQLPDFVCPLCRAPLEETKTALLCAHCNKAYALVEGIPVFSGEHQGRSFYEGRWTGTTGIDASNQGPKWLSWYTQFRYQYRYQRTRFFARALRRYATGGTILDIGCGGGQAVFPKFGVTVGLDLSLSSLRNAMVIYQRVGLSDIGQLPFRDGVFDVVVSAEVLGHVPDGAKQSVLHETNRVLRRDGIAIHVIETMGAVRRMARRLDAELFERYFVQQYGHVGMELPSATIARIERYGFETVYRRSRWSLLWWPRHYLEGFDNEYRHHSRVLNVAIAALARSCYASSFPSKLVRDGLNIAIGLVAPVVDVLLPFDYGNIVYAVFRKL